MAKEPGYGTFKLDPLTARMSIVSTSETQPPIYATAESLAAAVSEFPKTDSVPTEVASLLRVARNLLVTSVIHYEFAAIAMEKALQGVELAVRIRLNSTSARFKLFGLIDRLIDLPGFSSADVERLHDMRKMRNIFAHPKEAAALPLVMCVGWVRFCSEVIVEIFDPPNLPEEVAFD